MTRRRRHRPMHYLASALHDGTVLAAFPIRKPTPHVIRRDRLKIDSDGVAIEYPRNGVDIGDARNEGRTRFQDIIATNLNTRRAIHELVLPVLAEMRAEVRALAERLDRLQE